VSFNKKLLPHFWLLVLSINTLADDERGQMLERLQTQVATTTPEKGLLFLPSEQREVAFGAIDQLFPTRTITASTDPRPLVETPLPLGQLAYQVDQREQTIDQLLEDRRVRGFLVLQGNRILLEHYAQGHGPDTRWISFSVTKSVTSMLIGAAIRDGFIDSVKDPVTRYLPRFTGSAYETVTVGQVLQMASGIKWNEDYGDPESDVAKAGGANGLTLLNYLSELERSAAPGERFNYNTAETNLAGEILRAAIGNNATTYLERTIWHPFGMANDATWLLGEPYGGELGGCCISATLRDYGRLGLFAKSQYLGTGSPTVDHAFMQESTVPSHGYDGYGYLWWLWGDDVFSAIGIFGQHIYINPALDLVVAMHGNDDTADALALEGTLIAAVRAIEQFLQADQTTP
jgi:CubicO group peptidase (beta-lactamase class C family)